MKKNLKSTLKQGKEQNPIHTEKKEYYDINGLMHDTEPQKCCAKKILTENGSELCYIKMNSSEEIYHPIKNKMNKPMHHREMGMDYWKFKKVKTKVFSLYLSFLRTKNNLFYDDAIRGII